MIMNLAETKACFFDVNLKETVCVNAGTYAVEKISNPDPSQKGLHWFKIISLGYVFALNKKNARKLALL